MSNEVKVNFRTYAGLFMVTLATLMYEILLTRIFSVTMGYHFAFMAVSIAMFGMTVGALIVYLFPQRFPESIQDAMIRHPRTEAIVPCVMKLAII